MPNPILADLDGATSRSRMAPMNNLFSRVATIKRMLSGQNPQQVMANLLQTNPQFAQFMNENRGKSPEQIAREHGIDFEMLQNLLR